MSSHDSYLTFTVARWRCAVVGSRVIEVLRLEESPGLPLFDLRQFFGVDQTQPACRQCVIAIASGERVIGLVADEATDVIALSAADLVPVPSFGPRIAIDYLSALARMGDTFSLVLDLDHLLSPEAIELFTSRGVAP